MAWGPCFLSIQGTPSFRLGIRRLLERLNLWPRVRLGRGERSAFRFGLASWVHGLCLNGLKGSEAYVVQLVLLGRETRKKTRAISIQLVYASFLFYSRARGSWSLVRGGGNGILLRSSSLNTYSRSGSIRLPNGRVFLLIEIGPFRLGGFAFLLFACVKHIAKLIFWSEIELLIYSVKKSFLKVN